MNELQIFDNPEFGRIRGLILDGDPWFVGKDVATALGYSNASKAVVIHVSSEDKRFVMVDIADSQNGNVPTGRTKTAIINESGLYSLILSSKLPTAKRFKHWVTSEVLPAIRKTGRYEMEVPAAPARYAPTRPLTTDDYEDAARTIAKCHNSRLPLVIDLYRKAGLDIQEISAEETPQLSDERRKADLEFDSPDEAAAFVDDLRQRQQRFNVSSREEVNGKMRIRIQRAYNGNRLLTQ